jgi:lantibiotic modifying enzyme
VTADDGRADPGTGRADLASGKADLATGRAGGLAALLAVHAETGLTSALRSAIVLADRLAATWDEPTTRPGTGFLTGAAGEGWALLRAAAATGSQRYATAGRTALRHDIGLGERLNRTAQVDTGLDERPNRTNRTMTADAGHVEQPGRAASGDIGLIAAHDDAAPVDIGWCAGLSGAVLARIGATADDVAADKWLDEAVAVLGEHRPLRDTSLCHGELGVAEALIVLAADGDERAAAHRDRCAALLLGALEHAGPRCGTPRGVPSPGLLTGLAGIGFGLLRLGFADQVPSVLLLDPARPPY